MLQAGICGLGRWGQVLVRSVQNKSNLINFVAGCTGRKARAKLFCEENNIQLENSLSDLLNNDNIDAIILATPHKQHYSQIVSVANSGKHVFVEKPFTLTKKEAVTAISFCNKAQVICSVGHNRRFLPSMKKLKTLCNSGALGKIFHVEAHFHSDSGFNYDPNHWRANKAESPAGGMTGLGIHIVDALIALFGPITSLTAFSERHILKIPLDDTTCFNLKFSKGISGYVSTSIATSRDWRIQVLGNNGWAEMRGNNSLTISIRNEDKKILNFDYVDSEREELEAFSQAISGVKPYPVSLDEIVHATSVLEAVVESAKSNTQINL